MSSLGSREESILLEGKLNRTKLIIFEVSTGAGQDTAVLFEELVVEGAQINGLLKVPLDFLLTLLWSNLDVREDVLHLDLFQEVHLIFGEPKNQESSPDFGHFVQTDLVGQPVFRKLRVVLDDFAKVVVLKGK